MNRWRYENGEMVWETPLCTYRIYPIQVESEIVYILDYSDGCHEAFYERSDAKDTAEQDYHNRVVNIRF